MTTNRDEIVLSDPNKQDIQMKINLENTGEIPIVNKSVYIATATGIDITNNNFPLFDLDVGEKFIIGDSNFDQIKITPTKYSYLQLKKDSKISQVINIDETDSLVFDYKVDYPAILDIYVNNELLESITANTSTWTKYSYTIKKCDTLKNIDQCSELNHQWTEEIDLKIVVREGIGNIFINETSSYHLKDLNYSIL